MTLRQFLAVVRARWRLAASTFLVCVGGALAIAFLLPRQYSASASIVIDVKTPDPIAGVVFPALTQPSYMATQVDIIESDRVAVKVVRALRMTENADMRTQWQEATQGAGSFEIWLANLLQKSLDVKPSRESNMLHVTFKSVDPRFSAAVANAFVKSYIDTTAELRVGPARQYASFFDERSKQLLDAVERAQSRLSEFQRSNGILGNEERLDVETARLNELSSQLVSLQGIRADSQGREAAARSSPDQLQDVISHPVVADLRKAILLQQAKLEEMTTRFGDSHPEIIQQRANVAELQLRMRQETERLSRSVAISNGINSSREAQVRAALDAQRVKVLKTKQLRDEMAVLQREVEHAQRAYDAVMTRLNLTSLESQNTLTNASILVPASEPAKPSSPQRLLIALLGVLVGVCTAIALVLLRESTDRRVRTLEDVSRTLGLPVLGRMLGREGRTLLGKVRRHPIPIRVLGTPASPLGTAASRN